MLLDMGFNCYVELGDELNVPHGSPPTRDVLGFLLKECLMLIVEERPAKSFLSFLLSPALGLAWPPGPGLSLG